MKLAAAANISILSSESQKPDVCVRCIEMAAATGKAHPCGDCAHTYDVKFVVTIRVPEPSGSFRKIEKPKEIDCTLEEKTMKPDQYRRFLPHRASIAESKALMRCIRDALGLPAGYALDELKKPFIVAHVVPNLDAPEIRKALASSYLQSMGLLFEMPTAQKQLTAGATPDKPEPPAPPESEEGYNEGDYPEEDGPYPFDAPDEPVEPAKRHFCVDCGVEIVEAKNSKGKIWSPDDIVNYSLRTFGRCLCPNCQRAASNRLSA
jgi:hypothetical protein